MTGGSLTITYEDGTTVKIPGGAPTMLLHGGSWVDLLVDIFDPTGDGMNHMQEPPIDLVREARDTLRVLVEKFAPFAAAEGFVDELGSLADDCAEAVEALERGPREETG